MQLRLTHITKEELRILIAFATGREAEVISRISGSYPGSSSFFHRGTEVNILVTGVGGISTAWSLQKWLQSNNTPDMAINAGIAGSFNEKYPPGSVVMPVKDCFADLGMETENRYMTMAEAGLMDPDEFPFRKGWLIAENRFTKVLTPFLQPVSAVTVNTVSGTPESISRLKSKFNPDIETMEGATFFYICAREKIPFLGLRAISNMVVPRGKEPWDIESALDNLSGKMKELLNMLG